MSEQNAMSCGEFADVAAELSLGVLTGRERAQAVAHLDECDSCREHVRQLSLTGEEMLGLLPSREPPEGFETGVLGRLGLTTPSPETQPGPTSHPGLTSQPSPRSPKRWSRRMLTMAAAVLAVVVFGAGGWGLRGAVAPSSGGGHAATAETPLREAVLLTAAHQTEGKVYLYGGSPRWLYMDIDTHGSSNDTVICQLEARGGRVITIGSFKLLGGYGAWGSPDPVAASDVTGARLTSLDGTVLATASFTSSH